VDIFINRIFAKSITLNRASDFIIKIQLSQKMLEFNCIQIEFRPKGPLLSPKELEMSNDERKLSIGLTALTFH
jgi:hypothetical protein